MARSITIPSRLYNTGQHELSLPAIPADTTGCKMTLLRESWHVALRATIGVEISFNNGGLWQPWFSFAIEGGEIFKAGVLQTESWKASTWPGEFDGKDGQGRDKRRERKGTDLRVTLQTNRQFRSTVTLEAT